MAGLNGTTGQSPKTIEPGGMIGVLSAGRETCYAQFAQCLAFLHKPMDARLAWTQSNDIVGNCNLLCKNLMGEWLWILGDDHTFNPDILLRLLEHDVDIVVPLVFTRTPPYKPVVLDGEDGVDELGHVVYTVAHDLPETGLHEIHAAGSAGMLVKRWVIDAIAATGEPWFATDGKGLNEDLAFCRRARAVGARIWVDVELPMGHIAPHTVWPDFRDGSWEPNLVLDNIGTIIPLKQIRERPKIERPKIEIVRG